MGVMGGANRSPGLLCSSFPSVCRCLGTVCDVSLLEVGGIYARRGEGVAYLVCSSLQSFYMTL